MLAIVVAWKYREKLLCANWPSFSLFTQYRQFYQEEAADLIKDLRRRLIETSGELRSRAYLYLTQRISIAIQRGNAASIFATVPISNKLQEIDSL
jgi:hypothetical protein